MKITEPTISLSYQEYDGLMLASEVLHILAKNGKDLTMGDLLGTLDADDQFMLESAYAIRRMAVEHHPTHPMKFDISRDFGPPEDLD